MTAWCSTVSSTASWRRPATRPAPGAAAPGKKLRAEFSKEPHTRGAVSMARAQSPDSADSQFFICFDDASFLDGQYTVWGRVSRGMENVDKITRGEPPAKPDKIVSMRVAADAG